MCPILGYQNIATLTPVYLKFENEEVSPVGVLKRGGLKSTKEWPHVLRLYFEKELEIQN